MQNNNSSSPPGRVRSWHEPGVGSAELAGLASLVTGLATLPRVLELLEAQRREIAALREEIKLLRAPSCSDDGWMDAKGAAKYLDLSPGTFDKYRYETTPRITGFKLGGKTLYKRGDLDNFVKLWEIKSSGLA